MPRDAALAKLLAYRHQSRARPDYERILTDEWFPEERAFFEDPTPLAAAECGRRAGKTRGLCRDFIREALATPGYRGLYLNTTRGEAEQLAWWGNRKDGMASLVLEMKLPAKLDGNKLQIHFPHNDAWIYLRGADDEAELRKRLGGAYHKVVWDEAQKIPPKLGQSMREVFFPALLDFGGKFRMTGTPVRQMSGLFWDVTRPEIDKRIPGWSVHHWNLLSNPFFGRTHDERWTKGVLGLQQLYGGPDVAPIDSPIMQREAFGRWVREDAAYVYAVHKVPQTELFYAPHRARADGFVDVATALRDLPFPWQEAMYSLGVDIGYNPDPFALCLWAWHGHDPSLYEVASWKKTHLTSDDQVAAIHAIRQHVNIGLIVADASNPARSAVKGWSREWVARYNLPILEAEKQHKNTAIDTYNNDILKRTVRLRENSPLHDEMKDLQWATIVSGTGKLLEDPTLANDCCDASLYAHRHSYQYRWRPEDAAPKPGTRAALEREEAELMEEMEDATEDYLH